MSKQVANKLLPSAGVSDRKQLVQDLLTNIPQLENDLREELKNLQAMPPTPPPNQTHPPFEAAAKAILEGQHKYTDIRVPCLAIFAVPHDPNSFPPMSAEMRAAAEPVMLTISLLSCTGSYYRLG
ncbi:MAG TPA: hypothetical protein VFE27_14325 [Acidobacteriaceae bacterium]|nr:hypothetical protein [Acidobacteriaceae bacterium]